MHYVITSFETFWLSEAEGVWAGERGSIEDLRFWSGFSLLLHSLLRVMNHGRFSLSLQLKSKKRGWWTWCRYPSSFVCDLNSYFHYRDHHDRLIWYLTEFRLFRIQTWWPRRTESEWVAGNIDRIEREESLSMDQVLLIVWPFVLSCKYVSGELERWQQWENHHDS